MSDRPVKLERDEQQMFAVRVTVAGIIVFLALLGILGRLYLLQVLGYEDYTRLAQQNHQKRIPIPPPRGRIYDRNGVLLAGNNRRTVLEITSDAVGDQNGDGKRTFADTEKLLARLQELIPLPEKGVRSFVSQARKFKYQPVVVHDNLSEEEQAIFAVNQHRFPGAKIQMRMERYYPLQKTASHVIGYVGRIDEDDMKKLDKNEYLGTSHIGKAGVEAAHEKRLHGTAGFDLVEVDVHGKQQSLVRRQEPVGGEDLFLGLDINLQITAEKLLQNENGAVVALDPANGEVLALASMPTFDPNLFINGISSENYKALNEDPNRPLFNRALQGTYPPGSTIKPMVGIAGLVDGVITPTSRVYDRGYFRLSGQKHAFRCWNKRGHGSVDLKYAIQQSCDTYFYDMAHRMGIDRFSAGMRLFGFGERTGIDLPHEARALMPTREWKQKRHKKDWFPGDTVNIGIGQGYWTATPLQLAHATTIMANRGVRLKPHVLRAVRLTQNESQQVLKPEPFPPVIAEDRFWDLANQGMVNVMRPGGTASSAGAGASYRIAGKTGTAQVFGLAGGKYNARRIAKRLRDHALFVGFAPVESPKIAVAVIVENAMGGGGKTAAPLARKVMDAYLLQQYGPDKLLPEGVTAEAATGQAEQAQPEVAKTAKAKRKKQKQRRRARVQ